LAATDDQDQKRWIKAIEDKVKLSTKEEKIRENSVYGMQKSLWR
jgi:hypothetical protein